MWISGKITDDVIEGINRNKSVMIISEQSECIAQRIMSELHRGVTYLDGHGAFSGQDRRVINCIANNFEVVKIKEIVMVTDDKAFMFVTDVTEVLGKGFSWK